MGPDKSKTPLSEEPSDTLWSRGITYAVKSLWAEEGSYRGFSIGLIWQDSQWVQRPGWKYEIGWCGQNASLANSLLHDYQLHGNAESLSKALACLDTWSKSMAFANGLMRTHYDYQLGLTTSQERLACNLGTAALNFFEAAELTRQVGHAREHLRQMALGICYFILKDQEVSGRYGKNWAISGEALDREGTIGAFLIPPMLQAFVETTDSSYLQSGRQAHRYYMQEFRRSGSTSAGALDTYCIDKESAISLLRSGLRLYQLTNDSVYLQDAVAISYYLSTCLWHVDYPYADTSEFSQYGWSTLGGTETRCTLRDLLTELEQLEKLMAGHGGGHCRSSGFYLHNLRFQIGKLEGDVSHWIVDQLGKVPSVWKGRAASFGDRLRRGCSGHRVLLDP